MTDASKEGWGIKFPHHHYAGMFDKSLTNKDIALKELLIIFWALLLLEQREISVLIHTDSLVSVHVLKKGHSKSVLLDQLASVIWHLVLNRSIDLHLSYIPGNSNVRAD